MLSVLGGSVVALAFAWGDIYSLLMSYLGLVDTLMQRSDLAGW